MSMELNAAPFALGPEDLEACLLLDSEALDGLWTERQWQRELESSDRLCLGIRAGGRLAAIACGWLVVDELQITALAVTSSQRKRGLGRTVLSALLDQARRAGAVSATLEVASCNLAALALYQRCGFLSCGSRRGYYSDGRDALIQWRSLT